MYILRCRRRTKQVFNGYAQDGEEIGQNVWKQKLNFCNVPWFVNLTQGHVNILCNYEIKVYCFPKDKNQNKL